MTLYSVLFFVTLTFNSNSLYLTVLVSLKPFSSVFNVFKCKLTKKSFKFDKVQNSWPPSWISKKGIAQYL